ncbi:ABC transporter ATP-binding protein, partial [bacterium]|nr:ABC transporter ATP-binding protein [bacterium]
MIEIQDLSKDFGDLTVVDKLNLTVGNELFVFLGPNGAGKTTTIRMLTGLLRPTSGSIQIDGLDLWKSPLAVKRKIGLVPDAPYLYPKLTGKELLEFIRQVHQVEPDLGRKRISELMDLLELTPKANILIENYSFGMRRKLAIAAALLHQPKVLFLDEPTSGLDPRSAKIIKEILVGLVKQGTTVFMSTHILEIAENLCDRAGIIHQGRLITCGTVAELRQQSQHGSSSLEDIFLELTGGSET